MNFGKVCGCTVISSDEFYRNLSRKSDTGDEEARIRQLGNEKEEFLKLFRDNKR
jgi:hypothetical protein